MPGFLKKPRFTSVQANFLALNVPLVVLVVVSLFAFEETHSYYQSRAKIEAKQDRLMQSQAVILAEPVWRLDRLAVRQILATVLTDPDFRGAAVYDMHGALISAYGETIDPASPHRESLTLTFLENGKVREVGHIETEISMARIWNQLAERILIAALMAALVAIAAVLSSQIAFRRTIGEPLERFMQALKLDDVSKHRSVEWDSDDEIGRLVDAFNELQARQAAYEAQIIDSKEDLETRVAERTRELAIARDAAESASRSKSRFLANMSHELRTPLNAIIGFSEIMAMQTFGPVGCKQYEGYVDDIRASGAHLLALINDILDLSKAEAGKLELHEEIFELQKAFAAVCSLLGERAQAKGVSLSIGQAGETPVLWADRRKIIQVLTNLLTNAIKATPPGGSVSLTAERLPTGELVLRVEDNGKGIAEEDIPRVLEPFGQAGGQAALTSEGTGLGLPLARNLVEMHGGLFRIESELGVGTAVTLVLPAFRLQLGVATA